MNTTADHVTVIGGGVAGLSAALQLSQFGLNVDVVESTPFLGGRAIRFACKATDVCVKCGACIVEEKLLHALQNPRIRLHTNTRIENIHKKQRFQYELLQTPHGVDPDRCTHCGRCVEICPAGAVQSGTSAGHTPFFTLNPRECLNARGGDCRLCQQECPENAIRLDAESRKETCQSDALILATGFTPFDPQTKPYGYRRFQNVITNLELEQRLRTDPDFPFKPDDGKTKAIAFIQCVGSRDARLNHLWCSKICCGSSLRLANLLSWRHPETSITVFYIDIQNFGRDFQPCYESCQDRYNFQRSIPADIFAGPDGRLEVHFTDSRTQAGQVAQFDWVVLAVGICPPEPISRPTDTVVDRRSDDDGFIQPGEAGAGIFAAGAATGPMSISESVASAESAAWSTIRYLHGSQL